ncbi:competence protein ComEC [Sagittula marina]|uniref:Competence protein ComEC n=1 Tax=Sagittula marina TaxID=943940 RepID=A0A7W6DVB2_9RHOB|nr:ComEC/Rec2 family competence protein [Sagittula marina]MBB3986788.1 competence protein ComEC [Sagittula marina]
MVRYLLDLPQALLGGQRGHLFAWTPVLLACGIGIYFSLTWEPPVWMLWTALLAVVFVPAQALIGPQPVLGPLVVALSLISGGFGLAGLRAHQVAGPVLHFRYYGPIEGRVVNIDRSASDAVRLTLDQVVLQDMDPARVPVRVRVSLHGGPNISPQPGMVVILTGHLGPPGGAVEPGGFDFRRHAWFLRLGAVGYTRTPVLMLEPQGSGLTVFRARMSLSARVQDQLPGETGAFAAAVMSGDRSGMAQGTLSTLRDTNLAHLLAISGLHMGLLAGFAFASLRIGLLLVPRCRHYWPVKKLAAVGALGAAAGYLALSGGNVATERAFIMVAAALTALMLDRRALSLRSVAMAALIVLVFMPEALLGPGFQMSFAATVALVAAFEQVTTAQRGHRLPGWVSAVLSVIISSAVAGAATAPVGMAHFNQASVYGLLANLVSVPVMGALVVPFGVVAVLLMPLGLEWAPLWGMGLGLDWILLVAQHVAQWEGAVRPVVAPGTGVLVIIATGGLILCLWRGWGRLAGVLPLLLGMLLWNGAARPEILISDTGTLVGVMTAQGRGLSRETGSGFIADNWLENDGFGGDQMRAAARWPGAVQSRLAEASVFGRQILHVQGKRAARQISGCEAGKIVVSSVPLSLEGDCMIFDPERLKRTGSIAFWKTENGLEMVTASDVSGDRLWHDIPKKRAVDDGALRRARIDQ